MPCCLAKGELSEVVECGVFKPKPAARFCALLRDVVKRVGGWVACCRRRGDETGAPAGVEVEKGYWEVMSNQRRGDNGVSPACRSPSQRRRRVEQVQAMPFRVILYLHTTATKMCGSSMRGSR